MIEKNYRIENLKIVFAIMVVFIHTTAFIYINEKDTFLNYHIYRHVLELAVPFFLMVSGYIIVKRKIDYYIKYASKLLSIYLASTILYIIFKFIIILVDRIYLNKPFYDNVEILFESFTFYKIITGEIGQFHLWYLSSAILSLIVLYYLKKMNIKTSNILIISLVLYLISITKFIDLSLLSVNGGLFKALFYISLGMFVTELDKKDIKYPLIKMSVFIIALTVYKYFSFSDVFNLFLILASYYLFIFATKENGNKNILTKMSKYSLTIYILHVLVYKSLYKIFEINNFDISLIQDNLFYLFLFSVITILISILLHKPFEYLFVRNFEKILNNFLRIKK